MKSLVEVSRRVSAVSAGLLLKKADGWSPDLTIGLGDRTLAGLHFRKEEPFSTLLLGKRLTVAVDRPPGELKTISLRFDPEDLRYAKRILLLPATFRGQEAYILFGFRGGQRHSPRKRAFQPPVQCEITPESRGRRSFSHAGAYRGRRNVFISSLTKRNGDFSIYFV